MEYSLGRLGSKKKDESDMVFSEVLIEEIEEIFVARIKDICRTHNLLDSRCFNYTAHLWEFAEESSYSKEINRLLESQSNAMLYIARMACKGYSLGEGVTWKFYPENDFTKHLTLEEALATLNSQIESHNVLQIPRDLHVRLAAFILSNSKTKTYSFNAVLEQDAKKLVAEWYNTH